MLLWAAGIRSYELLNFVLVFPLIDFEILSRIQRYFAMILNIHDFLDGAPKVNESLLRQFEILLFDKIFELLSESGTPVRVFL